MRRQSRELNRSFQSQVKSVQCNHFTTNGVSTSSTVTINAVDPTNSIVFYLGFAESTSVVNPLLLARIDLTNSTTVTVTNNAATPVMVVSYCVLEFMPGVLKSVQRGTITLNNVTSNTATISAVNLSTAMLSMQGFTYNTGGNNDSQYYPRLDLTNATTITASCGTSPPSFNIIIGYQVADFY